MSSFSNAVVITGGIATGKSTASELLATLGYKIIDADKIALKQFDKNSQKILDLFGTLDRKAIASVVFADKEKKMALENLLHPAIRNEILEISSDLELENKIYFVDIPLFFETKNYPFTKSLLIYAPKELQIERMVENRSMSRSDAFARVDSQMDIEAKKPLATWVIENCGTKEQLAKDLENFLKSIN